MITAFPSNIFNDKDLEFYQTIKNKNKFLIRFSEKFGIIWVENKQNKDEHFIFCHKNITITTQIKSPINKNKLCLFDGLCDINYPEGQLIRFNKIKIENKQKIQYQFQSKYNFYLDLDDQNLINKQNIDSRVNYQTIRLCRSDQSYQQIFESIINNKSEL